MTKAYYDSSCRGHFGLSLSYYLHFTSPIRRFPDIKVHEALKKIWSGEVYSDENSDNLKEDGFHLSERELASKDAERDYHHYLLDLYVCDYIGKEVDAEVIFIDNDYLYLKALGYVEGVLQHNGNYDKDYKQVLFDGKKYQVGDKINVILRKFSKDLGQYIFTTCNDYEKKLVKKR